MEDNIDSDYIDDVDDIDKKDQVTVIQNESEMTNFYKLWVKHTRNVLLAGSSNSFLRSVRNLLLLPI
jgi:hypothetical protein